MSAAPAADVVTALARYLPEDRVDDACQLLRVDALPKLELMAREIRGLVDHAPAKPLVDDVEEGRASEMIVLGVAALKELDALRRKHTDPLNAEVKAINALFASVTDPCEALVGPLKSTPGVVGKIGKLLMTYRAEKRARREAAEREALRKQREAEERELEARRKAEAATTAKARDKANAEADAALREQSAAALAVPAPMTRGVRTDTGTVTDRERYVLEGFTNLDLVPLSYWRDPSVIEALGKVIQRAVTGGAREIPGCAIGVQESLGRRVGR